MYLNVLLLSDITLLSGHSIDPAAYEGDKDTLHSSTTSHEVKQAKPNDKAWAEWRQCRKLLCLSKTNHTLCQPSGAWTVDPSEYARQWDLYYSTTTDVIYHSTAMGYSVHEHIRHDYNKDTQKFIDNLPTDAIPIEWKETPHTWIRPRVVSPQDICPPSEATTFNKVVDVMVPWERNLLQHTVWIRPEDILWEALCHSQCFIATDGSAPKDQASFAWILSNATVKQLARCSGPVFGHAIS